jgi:hypothetical protein
MIESDGPILAEELNDIWNDTLFISGTERVKIILMESDETP